ncbi:hypothetical protein VTK26DRAFT_125 [Humicola hyalothermophila]
MPAAVASQWRERRRRVFQSVFQTDATLLTPQSTPSNRFPESGQQFGDTAASSFTGHPSLLAQQQQHHRQHGHNLPFPGGSHSNPRPITRYSTRTTPEPPPPLFPSLATAADDQVAYDRAWHVVTTHIALPSSATADDSFGAINPDSQQSSSGRGNLNTDFYDALALLVNASTLLPRATRTADIVAWHVGQVRSHFSQHVIPLLAGCVGEEEEEEAEGSEDEEGEDGGRRREGHRRAGRKSNSYERHMVIVMSSIRTLEAALRLYFYGLNQLLAGFARLAADSPEAAKHGEFINARFRRDIHALVSNSASEGLMRSVKVVLLHLAGTILGMPSGDESGPDNAVPARPAAPGPGDLRVTAARERLFELVQQLHDVGLAGDRFQVLFAEVMDAIMSAFVRGAYAAVWSVEDTRCFSASLDTISRAPSLPAVSPCISSLNDWIENHFARLSFEVLACISSGPQGPMPVSLADLKTYQSLALGRLAALRIDELFDIVLAWPSSRPALDDLRATITTAARRKQLTDSFSRTLRKRLLHPGCSTLEILRTYISIIRTLHALDPSKVLLSHVEPSLQLYLCQREDAIRVVVSGLLASPEEIRAAKKGSDGGKRQREKIRRTDDGDKYGRRVGLGPFATPTMPGPSTRTPTDKNRRDSSLEAKETPSQSNNSHAPQPTKLVELAVLLNDPSQTRRAAPELEEDLDWNDMNWVPDPVDAGANYKRPKSEDVIGTLISALGSEDVFIKEFSAVVAERLLGEPARFDQELRVLDLLKRRFGEPALQNCDVMIRDIQDSRRVDSSIRRSQTGRLPRRQQQQQTTLETPGKAADIGRMQGVEKDEEQEGMEYHARILSRLFWPNLDREHFLLPPPVVEQQRRYERGYESLKSGRKLTWLNQLGQARVELELRDRTVTADCTPVEATVIYAFQSGDGDRVHEDYADAPPARKSVEELYTQLQMDEDLIVAALNFWVAKGVLRRVRASEYVVVESLAEAEENPSSASPTAQQQQQQLADPADADPASVGKPTGAGGAAMSARERERRDMYWRYIQGMLTNASATMPLAQMAMMMKMLIADGFPWSNEELQEFLAEKVAEGALEVVGGKYKLVKK